MMKFTHLALIFGILGQTLVAMDQNTLEGEILYTYTFIEDADPTIKPHYLSIISENGMRSFMGPNLLELQTCRPINFNNFSNEQIDFYRSSKTKMVEFLQGKATFIKKIEPTENRLIFSTNILECVVIFIWKKNGPVAFAHIDTESIFNGRLERIIAMFNDQTLEEKKSFQVSLMSARNSNNLKAVYSALKQTGFLVTGQAVADLYADLFKQTTYITPASVNIPLHELKNKLGAEVIDNLVSKSNIPLNDGSFTFAATLSDGKIYAFPAIKNLIQNK